MVGIIKDNAAEFERFDMVFVAVLVKAEQHVRLVAGAKNFAAADADLENRRSAGNCGGNRHKGHDFLFATPGEARKETADGLNTILRITGDTDDRLVNFQNFGRATRRRRTCCCITHKKEPRTKKITTARWNDD